VKRIFESPHAALLALEATGAIKSVCDIETGTRKMVAEPNAAPPRPSAPAGSGDGRGFTTFSSANSRSHDFLKPEQREQQTDERVNTYT
jgi:hypothetical protein